MFLGALGLGLTATAASRLARVALAETTAAPKRFMLFYVPHGVPPEHFRPKVMESDRSTFSLTNSGESILGPLEEKFKQYTTVVEGLKYPDGAQTHEAIVVALSGLSGGASSLPDDNAPRVTLEHQIAKGLGVKPLILGACPHRPFGLDKDGKLMWDGTAVVPEKNPLTAYDAVFGNLGKTPSTGPDPDVALTDALRSLTEAELESMQKQVSGLTAEQTKLKTHLDAIRALKAGAGGDGGAISCDAAPVLPGVQALRTAAAGQSDDYFLREENFEKLFVAQLQIAGAALSCNARRVVAVQPMYTNCEFDFGFMGQSGAHHSALSHTGPQAMPYPEVGLDVKTRKSFALCQRWFYQQLVTHALTPLLEPDPSDPSKKIIDNTLIYVVSEIGEGAWHPTKTVPIQLGATPSDTSYLPSVIIGGGGGAVKPAQVVRFQTDRPAGELYMALCQAMGVTGSFPDSKATMTEVLA